MTTGGSGMELKTEILIIGGGASGMAAAVAAVEMGAEVTVAEANAAVGGNGLFPRGIFGVDSKIQRKKLVFADRDQIFRDCMNYSHWKIDGRIIRTLIDKSGDTVNWLMDRGIGKSTDTLNKTSSKCRNNQPDHVVQFLLYLLLLTQLHLLVAFSHFIKTCLLNKRCLTE